VIFINFQYDFGLIQCYPLSSVLEQKVSCQFYQSVLGPNVKLEMASVPAKLKSLGHYMKIANQYAERDPAVYYWCLLYIVQKGMQIDKSSPDCKQFLLQNMSHLEQIKDKNKTNEAITNEVVASAHVEEVALKLFALANAEDRAGRFNKDVVKLFYTAGYLLDILSIFGEMDTQILQQQKYAKWKAAYIHNCLKNGETPVAGPVGGDEGFGDEFGGFETNPAPIGFVSDTATFSTPAPQPPSAPSNIPAAPSPVPNSVPTVAAIASPSSGIGENGLQTADFIKAQKLCKYAISALEYEDSPTAIENLKQALAVLQMDRK